MRDVRAENVRRCVCGKAYEFFNMMVGDQSRCPECQEKLTREIEEGRKIHTDCVSEGGEMTVKKLMKTLNTYDPGLRVVIGSTLINEDFDYVSPDIAYSHVNGIVVIFPEDQ